MPEQVRRGKSEAHTPPQLSASANEHGWSVDFISHAWYWCQTNHVEILSGSLISNIFVFAHWILLNWGPSSVDFFWRGMVVCPSVGVFTWDWTNSWFSNSSPARELFWAHLLRAESCTFEEVIVYLRVYMICGNFCNFQDCHLPCCRKSCPHSTGFRAFPKACSICVGAVSSLWILSLKGAGGWGATGSSILVKSQGPKIQWLVSWKFAIWKSIKSPDGFFSLPKLWDIFRPFWSFMWNADPV